MKTFSLHQQLFIINIAYNKTCGVVISTVDEVDTQMHNSMSTVLQTGVFGLYIALQEYENRALGPPYLIYRTEDLVKGVRKMRKKLSCLKYL